MSRRPSPRTRCASCGWPASPRASRLHGRARDRGADAADGRGRRGRCAGARARLARGLARPDGSASPRGCSRCFARCGALARVLPEVDAPVRRAAARRLPPRGRHRRAPDDGARHGGAPRAPRSRCATPASATTSARARRRPRCCRSTSATRSAASRLVRAMSERLRVDNACRALADADRARARQRAPQRRVRRGGAACACSSAATRCAGPTASPSCCSPANATPAAGSASRSGRIRRASCSGRGACAGCSRRRRHARWPQAAAARAARSGPAIGAGDPRRAGRGAADWRLEPRRSRAKR